MLAFQPTTDAIRMAAYMKAMGHAARIVARQAERRSGKPMSSQAIRALVRGLLAEFVAAMPKPLPDLVSVSAGTEPIHIDITDEVGASADGRSNGWGPRPDPLADPHLIKGA